MRVSRFTGLFQAFHFRTSSKHSRGEVETIESTRSVIPIVSATVYSTLFQSQIQTLEGCAITHTVTTSLTMDKRSKERRTDTSYSHQITCICDIIRIAIKGYIVFFLLALLCYSCALAVMC